MSDTKMNIGVESTMKNQTDIVRNMVNHAPDRQTQKQMENLRYHYHLTVREMQKILPESRERSLAMTKMEEALMWSMASLARDSFDRNFDPVKPEMTINYDPVRPEITT